MLPKSQVVNPTESLVCLPRASTRIRAPAMCQGQHDATCGWDGASVHSPLQAPPTHPMPMCTGSLSLCQGSLGGMQESPRTCAKVISDQKVCFGGRLRSRYPEGPGTRETPWKDPQRVRHGPIKSPEWIVHSIKFRATLQNTFM